MKYTRLFGSLLSVWLMTGCQAEEDTMTLLESPVREVKVSENQGYGGMNEDYFLSIQTEPELDIIQEAIETAVKSNPNEREGNPDYDLAVMYDGEGHDLPTHGIHLWLGEPVRFMYIADDEIYTATPELSGKLNDLLK